MRIIGKSMYGTRYAVDGSIPFLMPNIDSLNYGDVVIDNGGKGMTMYINECITCGGKFLAGMLYFQPEDCKNCEQLNLTHSFIRND